MNSKDTISIVTVSDNHFAVLLAALIKSIDLNHKTSEKIDLYIVSDNISSKNKQKLIDINPTTVTYHWLDMAKVIPSRWTIPVDNSSFPLNVYTRLFIPYFIPEALDKILFLDVDMVVQEDISKLWHTDLKDHIIAGVVDNAKVVSSPWGGIPNYKELGLAPDVKYFNAGLQLIDPKKWREQNYTDKLLEVGRVNKDHVKWGDQYYLNVAFANKWLELDPRWNWFSNFPHEHPFLIHFIGNKPIYDSYENNQKFKEEFFRYLYMTPWKGYKPSTQSHRMLKKLYNLLKKKVKKAIS